MLVRIRHAANPACWIWPRSQFKLRAGLLISTEHYSNRLLFVKHKMKVWGKIFRSVYLEDFFAGGRPPARVLRMAAILRKYSGPRLAVACPPRRPRATAAGFFLTSLIYQHALADVKF